MTGFKDKDEAEKYILGIPKFAAKTGPENLRKLLDKLGNPELDFRTIHIAGTNGKGSVAKLISDTLINMGFVTGVFTSPHMLRINERISVSGSDIPDEDFCRIANLIIEKIENFESEGGTHPSFFEFVFIMSCVYFSEKGVSYAVMETGLGGRLDATNILEPVISVITSIGMDHMQYLGDTIEQIAFEKAGIIKKGIPVVYNIPDKAAEKVIEKRASELGSPAFNAGNAEIILKNIKADAGMIDFSVHCGYYSVDNLELRSLASYEIENAVTAFTTLFVLFESKYGPDYMDAFRKSAKSFSWTGRMEFIRPSVLLDGAHNVPAAERLLDSIDRIRPILKPGRIRLLFAVANDKDYNGIIRLIMERLRPDAVYITGIRGDRQTELERVGKAFDGCETIRLVPGISAAFREASYNLESDELLICMGSLYLIADIIASCKG